MIGRADRTGSPESDLGLREVSRPGAMRRGRAPPAASPATSGLGTVPDQHLAGDPAIEQHGPPGAERAHHGGHLGGGEAEREILQRAAQALEAGHGDENAAVARLAEGEAGVAVPAVHAQPVGAERRRHLAVALQHRGIRLEREPRSSSHVPERVRRHEADPPGRVQHDARRERPRSGGCRSTPSCTSQPQGPAVNCPAFTANTAEPGASSMSQRPA